MPHGNNEWVLIENRYSEEGGTTSAAEIVGKYDLIAQEQHQNLSGRSGLRCMFVSFVVSAHRYFACCLCSLSSATQRMQDWLLVIASLRDNAPTAAELQAQLSSSTQDEKKLALPALVSQEVSNARSSAGRRLVVLNRDALIKMFGPSFTERSRLLVDKFLDGVKKQQAEERAKSSAEDTQTCGGPVSAKAAKSKKISSSRKPSAKSYLSKSTYPKL
jgi:hypothetical protein